LYLCKAIRQKTKNTITMTNTLVFSNLPEAVQKRVIIKEEENYKNFLKMAGLQEAYNFDHFNHDVKEKVNSKIYYQDHNTFFELTLDKL
jgi:hypothetical protein